MTGWVHAYVFSVGVVTVAWLGWAFILMSDAQNRDRYGHDWRMAWDALRTAPLALVWPVVGLVVVVRGLRSVRAKALLADERRAR